MNECPSLEAMPKSSCSSMTMMIAELPGSLMVRGADGGFSVTLVSSHGFTSFTLVKRLLQPGSNALCLDFLKTTS